MALNKGALEGSILGALNAAAAMEDGAAAARSLLAAKIAAAIDAYVRTADVKPGIPVSTGGATTGIGKLS